MIVVVTGGCGLIGSAFVRALADRGDQVVVLDVDDESGEELVEASERVVYRHCDVTDSEDFDRTIRAVRDQHGRLDAVVHSAYPRTASWGTRFEDLDEDEVAENLRLQLGSAIMVSQKAVNRFREQGSGHLIHISSIQGIAAPKFRHYEGTDMTSPIEYTAIKHGVVGLTRYLAKYLSGTGIRVNCISPGGVEYDQPESFQRRYQEDCTGKGLLDPEEIAGPLLFLLSDQSERVNGQNLIVDDGWSL